MKTLVLALLVLLFTRASARQWITTSISTGAEAGAICDVAIDLAGRIHVAWVDTAGPSTRLRYAMRPDSYTGFGSAETLLSTTSSNAAPVQLSIDISSSFDVEIAFINGSGSVSMYRKQAAAAAFSFQSVASGASTTSSGGLSLVSSGNGFSQSSIAFTASNGRARFVQRASSSAWRLPVDITTGASTGQAPVLFNTSGGIIAPSIFPYAVICYNDSLERLQISYYNLLTSSWTAAEAIAPCPNFARVDADVFFGKIGVSFSYSAPDPEGGPNIRQVRFAENTTGSGGAWSVSTITDDSELTSDLELFGATTGMYYDASGHPVIAYSRDFFAIFAGGTSDIRVRRRIPGANWEYSLVETISGSGFFFTGRLALAEKGAGDPALVYERDPGSGESTVVFARPLSRPWVIGTPEAISQTHAFAPALAAGPDGAHHLVAGVATGGVLTPRDYLAPRLVSYRNDVATTITLGSSSNPHVANAISVTPDGAVHTVSLRLVTTSSTTGDLLYNRVEDGAVVQTTVVNSGSAPINVASPGTLALDHDSRGNLYLAYRNSSGGLTVATRPPSTPAEPEPLWINLATASGNYIGMDLAARPDGGFVATGYNATDRRLHFISNIDTTTSELGPVTNTSRLTYLPSDTPPGNTSCVIMPDGLPRAAASRNDRLVYLEPRLVPAGTYSSTNVPDTYSDATVELAANGYAVHFLIHDTMSGGRLHHYVLQTAPIGGLFASGGEFATPAVALGSLGGTVAATIDSHGQPVCAAGIVSRSTFPFFLTFDQILLARPADAIDRDHDGIPLVCENFFLLGDNFANPSSDLPAAFTNRFLDGASDPIVEMGYTFRVPNVPEVNNPVGRLHGEFLYGFELSTDLQVRTQFPLGVPGIGRFYNPLPGGGSNSRNIAASIRTGSAYRADHPRLFAHLLLFRAR